MFDNRVGNKQREFPRLHQIGQQKSVFSPESGRIKHSGLDVCPSATNGKPCCVQVTNAPVRLKHVFLKRDQPQFFCSPNQIRAIPYQPKLKAIMLRRVSNAGSERSETVCVEFAVSVHE